MKFVCERCNTRYSIADDKVRQKILKIRCKTCENVITVRDPTSPAAEPAQVSDRQPQPPPAPPARGATPPPAVSREWFVAVNGDQTGPLTRGEAARRVADGKPDDEIYVWKEGLDGWKAATEVPAIQQELNALRGRPGRVPPAAPSRPGAAPVGRAAPAAARSAPATASLAQPNAFEDDHTQIQPFDAAMLGPAPPAADLSARSAPAPAAVLAFKSGRQTNGAMAAASAGPPVQASNSLDGLFSDFPPAGAAPGPAAFAQAPASLQHTTRPDSGLSKLTGFAGFMSRNPGLKFVAGGAVVVVLIALMVVVLVVTPGDQKPPPPPAPVATVENAAPPPPSEAPPNVPAKAAASVASVGGTTKGASMGAPRNLKTDRKQARTPRPSINPPAPGGLEPAPLAPGDSPNTGATARGTAPGERVVPAYVPKRSAAAPDPSGGPGGPAQGAISAVVNRRDNQTTLKVCYDRALKRDEKIGGRIVVTATIGMSGLVKGVALNAPPEFASVEPCLKQAIRRWAFPANNDEYQAEFTVIMQGSL